MKNIETNILNADVKAVIALMGTGTTFLIGEMDLILKILIICMGLDYLAGVTRAFIEGEVSSQVGFKGIARKCQMLIVLVVAVLLDRLINNGEWVFRTLICFFYIANEGISILENCAATGLKIPPQLKEVLIQIKNRKNINKEEKEDE